MLQVFIVGTVSPKLSGNKNMIRKLQFFVGFFLLGLLGFIGSAQAQTAPILQVCQLSDFTAGPFGHSIYLHYLPGAVTPRYRWDANGGIFTIYADSTARVTGRVFNDSLPNWQWDIDFWFINQKDFASWSALGRDVKIEYAPASLVNANKPDWLFWEFDSTRSRIFGVPGTHFDGDTLLIRHNPPNREFGLQYGVAANAKNGNFGMSGWFLFSGSYSGYGDINVNATCGPPPCTLAGSSQAICQTDSTFAASVTITSSGGTVSITDDYLTPALLVNGPGTYLFGSYPSNASVTIFLSEPSLTGCEDTLASITTDCTPPPVCEADIQAAMAACVTDSTFGLTVTIAGSGSYILSDNQGTAPLLGLGAGTYSFGTYPSGTVVTIFLTDPSIAGCADTLGGLTATCVSAPVCEVEIDSATAACNSDSTFSITVSFTGVGPFTLSDNQGTVPVTGLTGGSVVFGNYASGTIVTIFLTDPSVAACADTLTGLTATCVAPPVCDVAIDSASAVCKSDSTFEVVVSFVGAGPFTLSDNQGTAPVTGLSGGTYSYGTYPSNAVVKIFLSDPAFQACVDSLAGLTALCEPPQLICGVVVDTLYSSCATDTSFTVFVQFSGAGNNFQISDDQGSTPVGGLTAGLYSFGNYFNSTEVLITVTDLTIPGCDTTVGPVTADCTPVALCDLSINSAVVNCVSDSTFEVVVEILGTGSFYQIFDNQGSFPLFPVAAGFYTFGPYVSGSQVAISAMDFAIFNCFASVTVTDTCSSSGSFLPEAELWADPVDQQIMLSWHAEKPSLLSGFFVQRSVDPEFETDWQTIAWVPMSLPIPAPAAFEYADTQVSPNIEYTYRLKLVPSIGSHLMSNEASATIEMDGSVWIGDFYPNPVGSGEINFGMTTPRIGQMTWSIFNTVGTVMRSGSEKALTGTHTYQVDVAGLNSGIYFLQVWFDGQWIRTKKILVTN